MARIASRVAAIAESATLAVDAKAKALTAAGEPVRLYAHVVDPVSEFAINTQEPPEAFAFDLAAGVATSRPRILGRGTMISRAFRPPSVRLLRMRECSRGDTVPSSATPVLAAEAIERVLRYSFDSLGMHRACALLDHGIVERGNQLGLRIAPPRAEDHRNVARRAALRDAARRALPKPRRDAGAADGDAGHHTISENTRCHRPKAQAPTASMTTAKAAS